MTGSSFSRYEQVSRDDRASIATCSLLTPTDRFKENYSIDVSNKKCLGMSLVSWWESPHMCFLYHCFNNYAAASNKQISEPEHEASLT